jgi:AcrR family transcriptional regulator
MPMSSTVSPEHRLSAEERREQVLRAAIHEFAEHGYHAARTAAIAEAAGISQPYIYALFPNKKVLFLACQDRVRERIHQTFEAAMSRASSPEEALRLMGRSFESLLADRDFYLCQLQGYAASGDSEIREHMRRGFMAAFDYVAEKTGAGQERVAQFFATGMLLNIGTALDLPRSYSFAPPHSAP